MILYDPEKASELIETLGICEFQPRFPGMVELAREARTITMRHGATDSVVDIALGCMPFEEKVQARAQVHQAAV